MPIYFIREEAGAVKIGQTQCVGLRLATIQTGNPRILTILGVMGGDRSVERSLHKRFRPHHVRGEWFAFADEIRDFIRDNAEPYDPAKHDPAGPPAESITRPTAKRGELPPCRCAICDTTFVPESRRNTCCSPQCQRERKRRVAAAWYGQHGERHKTAVVLARRERKQREKS